MPKLIVLYPPPNDRATFEHRYGFVEVSFAKIQHTGTDIRHDKAEWIIDHLGIPNCSVVESDPLSKRAYLSQAPAQPVTGGHGREVENAKSFANQITFEYLHIAPEEVKDPRRKRRGF